jgi:alpha-tubulin suppressor-like RCC1 family protein
MEEASPGSSKAKDTKEEHEEAEEIWGWSWGAGTDGQLGTGSFQDEHLPRPLRFSSPFSISRLACGGAHSVALTCKKYLLFTLFLWSVDGCSM